MKARLGIVAVGQKKIGCVLVCGIELSLGNRRNLRLARGRPGILLDFLLRITWSCEEAAQPEQRGVCNRISIHGFRPLLFEQELVHAGVLEI